MTKRALAFALTLLGSACRLGGPEGSPLELVEVDGAEPPEQRDAAGAEEEDDLPSDVRSPEPGPPPPALVDAATPAAPDAAAASCQAPANLECDPVSGEGCLPLMQCIVDPSSVPPAAYCVFSGLLLDVTCLQDEFSTNCPPQYTCVMGECRQYCYCDTDCDDGAACSDSSAEGGSGAFKLCERALP